MRGLLIGLIVAGVAGAAFVFFAIAFGAARAVRGIDSPGGSEYGERPSERRAFRRLP